MVTARPVLGMVSCARQVADETGYVVMRRYVDAAARYADCAVLLIPAQPNLMRADEVADRIDGLLLTGSPSNIAPARFGQHDDPGEGPFDPGRDAMSLALVKEMLARGRPVFGICRGLQELNVAFGGTLQRGLGAEEQELPHHAPDGVALETMFGHRHAVALAPGGVLQRALQRDALDVNSVHYQGVATLGEGLSVEASAADGLVEAFSAEVNGAPVLAVQWHPEWRAEDDAASQTFFGLLGAALRGQRAVADQLESNA